MSGFGFGIPGPMELLILLMMSGGGGLPLGIPPAPEDPVMSRVAPDECLLYVTWTGMAAPDPASQNHTERLLAEEEVRHFVAEIERRILAGVRRELDRDPEAAAMVDDVGRLLKAMLTRPAAIFIAKPDVSGGAIFNLGDQAEDAKKTLEKLEGMLFHGAPERPGGGGPWRSIPMPRGAPPVEWGVKGRYLVIGVGQGAADGIDQRAQTDPPAWLVEVREQLAVPRPANLVYVDVAGAVSTLMNMAGPREAELLDTLGLNVVRSFASVTGLDESGCVSRSLIAVDGEPRGFLTLAAGKPLSAEDLSPIPRDATVAAAARLDLARLFEEFLDFVGRIEPRGREEIMDGLAELDQRIGVRLDKDVFQAVGDVWRVYNSPGEGGLLVTGLTAVVTLRDRDRLADANRKLVALAREAYDAHAASRRPPRGPTIDEFRFRDETVYFLKVVGEPFPLAPAWCISDDELIVATFPQNVKAYLAGKATRAAGSGSLAEVPEVARVFAGDHGAPLALCYQNTPEIFGQVYPLVQMFARIFCSQLQRDGVDIDVSILPSAPSIARHLQPGVTIVTRTQAGVLVESRQTLPIGGGGLMTLPILSVVWLAPVRMIDEIPTPQRTSMNNMKQIGLAMHMHHDVYKQFPPAAIQSEDGKPLLSWRVKVLPFVEQGPLYDAFHLDEPWDSPHNQKLIAAMPPAYRAPRSQVADQGKTNYLGISGKDAVFFGGKGRKFSEIYDGTSNTIMVVEASDERAVIWTKPDDFEYSADNPIAGLVGLQRGGFLALFCDGSVRLIPETIDADTLRAVFTIRGAEVIDPRKLENARRPGRPTVRATPVRPPGAPTPPPPPEEEPAAEEEQEEVPTAEP